VKLLHQNSHQCLLYSAAMVLGEDPAVLLREIGHDGLDIWWSELYQPYCHRGHHIQEIIDCFVRRGFGLMPIQVYPTSKPRVADVEIKQIYQEDVAVGRFLAHIGNRPAILIGASHSYAWDGEKVFDPNGVTREIADVNIMEAWIMTKLI